MRVVTGSSDDDAGLDHRRPERRRRAARPPSRSRASAGRRSAACAPPARPSAAPAPPPRRRRGEMSKSNVGQAAQPRARSSTRANSGLSGEWVSDFGHGVSLEGRRPRRVGPSSLNIDHARDRGARGFRTFPRDGHALQGLATRGSRLLGRRRSLAGCAPTTQVHGYVPPAADVARLTPGVDTTATVEETLGLPTSTGLLRDSAWFYVQSVFENYTFYPARVVDRTVLVVNFNSDGVVTGVETYGVEDGRIINLTSRTTETGGRAARGARAALRQHPEHRRGERSRRQLTVDRPGVGADPRLSVGGRARPAPLRRLCAEEREMSAAARSDGIACGSRETTGDLRKAQALRCRRFRAARSAETGADADDFDERALHVLVEEIGRRAAGVLFPVAGRSRTARRSRPRIPRSSTAWTGCRAIPNRCWKSGGSASPRASPIRRCCGSPGARWPRASRNGGAGIIFGCSSFVGRRCRCACRRLRAAQGPPPRAAAVAAAGEGAVGVPLRPPAAPAGAGSQGGVAGDAAALAQLSRDGRLGIGPRGDRPRPRNAARVHGARDQRRAGSPEARVEDRLNVTRSPSRVAAEKFPIGKRADEYHFRSGSLAKCPRADNRLGRGRSRGSRGRFDGAAMQKAGPRRSSAAWTAPVPGDCPHRVC